MKKKVIKKLASRKETISVLNMIKGGVGTTGTSGTGASRASDKYLTKAPSCRCPISAQNNGDG